jgi:CRISPR-associated exonuclease Cas4
LPAIPRLWLNFISDYFHHRLDYPIDNLNLVKEIGLSILLPFFSILFLLIGLIFFIISKHQRRQAGIPAGKVIFADTGKWRKLEKPLFDPHLRLTGKPDYLVMQGDQVIPIEVKSRVAPRGPYDSHIYQLAAYCLLVQQEYGNRPDYGIIHYRNQTYAVDFTPKLEESIKVTIREMQAQIRRSNIDRSHDNPQYCEHCGYRSLCDQSLRI